MRNKTNKEKNRSWSHNVVKYCKKNVKTETWQQAELVEMCKKINMFKNFYILLRSI